VSTARLRQFTARYGTYAVLYSDNNEPVGIVDGGTTETVAAKAIALTQEHAGWWFRFYSWNEGTSPLRGNEYNFAEANQPYANTDQTALRETGTSMPLSYA